MELDMPRQWQEQSTDNLSGGITDYVDNAPPSQSAIIENFVITRDRGIRVRDGSGIWSVTYPNLPGQRKALQLFQLEQYIFAYTDDGDCYWTFDDGSAPWTQIQTTADISNKYGSDYLTVTSSGKPLYWIPDDTVQSVGFARIAFEIRMNVTVGAGIDTWSLTVGTDGASITDYFIMEIFHFTDNPLNIIWTNVETAALQAGLTNNGRLPWTVADDTVILNETAHPNIPITLPSELVALANTSGTHLYQREYHPIYFYRLKAFYDISHQGVLSVSKFSGHLYLSMFPDDRTYTPNDDDLNSTQPDVWPVQNKRLGLRKIYLLYDPVTQTATPRLTSAQMPPIDIAAEAQLGTDVGLDSNNYIYEGYCRHTYEALVEGEPRQFIVDGPSTQVAWPTDFTITNNKGDLTNPKIAIRILPRVGYDQELYPLDEMTVNFFRTTNNQTIPYLVNTKQADQGLRYIDWAGSYSPSFELEQKWDTGESEEGEDPATAFRGLFYNLDADDPIDNFPDTLIDGNEEAYDSTTSFGYTTVPQGPYFFTVSNQVGYYADIFKLKNRVYQSIYGIPHATTSISFLDFDDGITGIATFRDRAIVFTRESTWRMEGLRGLDGRGSITQRLISDEFGTISNQSIVLTNYGLFFLSRTGICYTDGFKCLRVSEQIFETYFTWIEDVDYIRGFYHESDQKVYWALRFNQKTWWLVMDLRYGISPEIPLVMQTGLDQLQMDSDENIDIQTVDRFPPNVCLVNEKDQRILRHVEGYILVHDKKYTTDWYQFQEVPIVFKYLSSGFDFGTKNRKWVANVKMVCKQKDELGISLQPIGVNDLTGTERLTGSCFNYGKMQWGDPLQVWRNPDAFWEAFKIVKFRRMFPEGSIRATYKQFGIKSLYVHGPDSETHGGANYTAQVIGTSYRTYITIPMSLSDAGLEMEGKTVDESGSFAIMLPGITGKDWNVIHRVDDNTTSFDVYIAPDTDTIDDHILQNIEWALGYIRSEERIGLDNYSLRYTVIGERTDGAYENSDGGSEGDGTEG
jgi:hypothetical protein